VKAKAEKGEVTEEWKTKVIKGRKKRLAELKKATKGEASTSQVRGPVKGMKAPLPAPKGRMTIKIIEPKDRTSLPASKGRTTTGVLRPKSSAPLP
jgi:hypothetical protein